MLPLRYFAYGSQDFTTSSQLNMKLSFKSLCPSVDLVVGVIGRKVKLDAPIGELAQVSIKHRTITFITCSSRCTSFK